MDLYIYIFYKIIMFDNEYKVLAISLRSRVLYIKSFYKCKSTYQ